MTVKPIIMHPDPLLEQTCERVEIFDSKLKRLVRDMFETMYEADGVGLAGPQIGVLKQIAVVDADEEIGPIVLINPEIYDQNGEELGVEGCLSIPSLYGEVVRSQSIKVKAFDVKGRQFDLKASGFVARAIQHEIDHLQGILFTSKVVRYIKEEELEVEG
ncbi:peptide deformylase [Bacillus litorisediminis]|uniref:peptide deformylase n=1 Tax=Bacillus litorisediminis TaxID=2922713 RepID=UPI001FAECDC8|nr:peptide deformylase [Bacillus litorisediminis]